MFGHLVALISFTHTTPCFPDLPPLVATEVWTQLEKFAWSATDDDSIPPPQGIYGSCRIKKNVVTSADGKLVMELGCAVRVLVPGIVDDLGLQIGALGQDVIDRKPRPVQKLTCMANGPDQVRCRFDREPEAGETDSSWYVVEGTLGDDVLTGAAATKFFAARRLVELDVSVWCH